MKAKGRRKRGASGGHPQGPRESSSGASWSDLLQGWSLEFSSQANRVRTLIGDAHWLSDGEHKEELVRSILKSKLPARLHVTQGFILDPTNRLCSPQSDVLVLDSQLAAPFFMEAGLSISSPEACIAAIEVKSSFRMPVLRDALGCIGRTDQIMRARNLEPRFWKGIFFADWPVSRTHESAIDSIMDVFREYHESKGTADLLADLCIVCSGRFCCYLQKTNTQRELRMKYFPAGHLSLAACVIDLVAHCYSTLGLSTLQPLEEVIGLTTFDDPVIRKFLV